MHVPPVRSDGLQIEEQRSFQQAFWTFERCAWLTFALVLVLALAGLTGAGGYFATATSPLSAGNVEYPRISRWESSDEVKVTFNRGRSSHQLTLAPVFLQYFEVEGIEPQPERATTTPEGTVLEFSGHQHAAMTVVVYVRALRPGIATYSIGLDGTATRVSTVILP